MNPVLEIANYFLGDKKYKPFAEFELFNKDNLPTNSDVLVILSQYSVCLEKYHEDSIEYYDYKYHWIVNGNIIAPEKYENI